MWAAVAKTVRPMSGKVPPRNGEGTHEVGEGHAPHVLTSRRQDMPRVPFHHPADGPPSRTGKDLNSPPTIHANTLDASWDKKLARAVLSPDFTLDLHGHSLSAAHARLDQGLAQAAMLDARLVLVITGRPRPAEAADRGERRGAIRAKVLDWLALGPHASRIAAVRPAHRRHGGAGALYVVLRRLK